MSREPMWRLLHQCALKLTKAGHVPFTRADLIASVRETVPNAIENSLNPIIQGITDNLKGGAPGADGTRILHSAGRGQFVLLASHEHGGDARNLRAHGTKARTTVEPLASMSDSRLPESEGELRDIVLVLLREQLRDADCVAEPEGPVSYRVPSGQEFGHASDILVSTPSSVKRVSIEIKYRSAVTDQFKCGAYDAIHMKRQHGDALLTALLYAKTGSGIGVDRARSICYSFDRFYGGAAAQFLVAEGIGELAMDIRQFLFSGFWRPSKASRRVHTSVSQPWNYSGRCWRPTAWHWCTL